MCVNIFSEINEILLKKTEDLQALLAFSSEAVFKGTEDEIELFQDYISKRQLLIDDCLDLDSRYDTLMKTVTEDELKNCDCYQDILNNRNEIKNLSTIILNYDKEINSKMENLFTHIKSELHKIQFSKNVNKRYQNQTVLSAPSFFFDKKN